MKKLLCVLAVAFPLCAGFGFHQAASLTVAAVRGCGTFNPIMGSTTAQRPGCLFVSLNSTRADVSHFVVTITFVDEQGEFRAEMKLPMRTDGYTTLNFSNLEGADLMTVEVEQCTNTGCFDWHQFRLD